LQRQVTYTKGKFGQLQKAKEFSLEQQEQQRNGCVRQLYLAYGNRIMSNWSCESEQNISVLEENID
jgi:hypothetical protein